MPKFDIYITRHLSIGFSGQEFDTLEEANDYARMLSCDLRTEEFSDFSARETIEVIAVPSEEVVEGEVL